METIKTTTPKPTNDIIRFQDLWGMFMPRWRWFLASVIICVSASILYLAKTPNVYTRTAELLVKDDGKNGSGSVLSASEFSDLGIFNTSSNINNELVTIKSPTIMTEVVKRLRLNENFSMRQGLKNVTLYKMTPVNV